MQDSVGTPATAILVLGMHRSGTSALAAAVERMGASLGGELVPAGADNPGGYFENAAAVTTHEILLAELGRGWEDIRELPLGWLHTDAGLEAGKAITELLAVEFADKPLWALKDPRLCRLLPLWRQPLANAFVEPKCLFVLRNPDEVAASLAKRDDIGMDHAYLLWLRYFLDAERDSRSMRRCMLTYEDLLADPAGCLTRVSYELGIEWPHSPQVESLSATLNPEMRHHRVTSDAPAEGPRLLALELYRLAIDGKWQDAEPYRVALQQWTQKLTPWLNGPGNALARARRDGIRALQRCQVVEAALEETKSVSLLRLDELHMLHARLEATDLALQEATVVSLARMEEMRALDIRLESTDAALQEAQALSLSRLDEIKALHARLHSTDAALEEARALSYSRLHDLKVLDTRLAKMDEALSTAESLSVLRLEELRVLDTRLQQTDRALQAIEAQSMARLRELEALAVRVDLTDAALVEAERLSVERLQQVQACDLRLLEMQTRADSAERTAALLSTQLQEIKASKAWRLLRTFGWLGRRMGMSGRETG